MICLFTNAILAVNAAPRCPPSAAFFYIGSRTPSGSRGLVWSDGKRVVPIAGSLWRVGGRDRALLRRGPEENAPPSAALSHSTIILWWQTSAAAKRSVAQTLSAFYIQNGRLRGDRCWPWPVSPVRCH